MYFLIHTITLSFQKKKKIVLLICRYEITYYFTNELVL